MRAPAFIFLFLALQPGAGARAERPPIELAQFTPLTFNAWRPYKNPDKLVQVGMTKGQVLAIAGKPDYEDSYYQGARDALSRISDWYYVKPGPNGETAQLKFVGDTLTSISITPLQ